MPRLRPHILKRDGDVLRDRVVVPDDPEGRDLVVPRRAVGVGDRRAVDSSPRTRCCHSSSDAIAPEQPASRYQASVAFVVAGVVRPVKRRQRVVEVVAGQVEARPGHGVLVGEQQESSRVAGVRVEREERSDTGPGGSRLGARAADAPGRDAEPQVLVAVLRHQHVARGSTRGVPAAERRGAGPR